MPSRSRAPPILLFRHALIEAGGLTPNDAPAPGDDGSPRDATLTIVRHGCVTGPVRQIRFNCVHDGG
jgi:hypothetical protein